MIDRDTPTTARDRDTPTTGRVHDPDPVRAAATARLLDGLARGLRAPVDRASVHVDADAATATRARGAAGLAEPGRILLDPARYDPATPAGRRVLAHEAAHLAQPAVSAPGHRVLALLAGAEAEAEAIASAAAAGQPVSAPRAPRPAGVAAANTGDAPAAPTGQADPLATRTADPAAVAAHPQLHRRLAEALDGPDLSETDVDGLLAALAEAPIRDASGIVHALGAGPRRRLTDAVASDHQRRRTRAVLAAYHGLDRDERAQAVGRADVESLVLSGLDRDTHLVAVEVLRSMDPRALLDAVTRDANGPAIRRLMSEGAPTAEEEAAPAPAEPPAPRTVDPAALAAVTRRLTALLTDPGPDEVAAALRTVRDFLGEQAPAPQTGAEPAATHPPLPSDRAAALVAQLEVGGAMSRLVAGLPADLGTLGDLAAVAHTLLAHRDRAASASQAERLLSRSITDWAVTDADAMRAYPLVLAIARTDGQELRRLDAAGKVDELFGELPDAFLYRADTRASIPDIMAERDPAVLERRTRAHLSLGLFDWAVTARDAFLAQAMVRELPDDRRQALQEADGGTLWARLTGEMTASMRGARDRHHFRRDTVRAHRDEVRTQLDAPEIWSAAHAAQLRTLVHLAFTLGDGAWVFARSRRAAAHRDPVLLDRVVRPYGLYHPPDRERFAPGTLEGTSWWEEGPLQWIAEVARGIALLSDGNLWIADRAVGAADVDLERVQWALGGDLAGLRLDTAGDTAGGDTAGQGRPRRTRTNRVDVSLDPFARRVTVDLPELAFQGFRSVDAGRTIGFGAGTVRNLRLVAQYAGEDLRDPVEARIDAAGLTLADLLYGSGAMLLAAAGLTALPVAVRAGSGALPPTVRSRRGTPVPVFGAFGFVLDVAARAFGDLVGRLLPTTGRAGVADEPAVQAAAITAVDVGIGELTIDGAYYASPGSEPKRVARIALHDLHLGTATTRAGHLRLLVAALERQVAATPDPVRRQALADRLDHARAQLAARDRDDADLRRLADRFQRDPFAMTDADRARMRQLRDRGGVVVDARTVELTGLSAGIDVARLEFGGVLGEGHLDRPLLQPSTTAAEVQRFIDEGPPAALTEDARLELDLGDVAFTDLTVPAAVPTAASLEADLAALDARAARGRPVDPDERADVTAALAAARELEELVRRARDPAGGGLSDAQATRAGELRALLRARGATTVERGHVRRLGLDSDLRHGRHGLSAGELELTGVRRGQVTAGQVTAGQVTGTNVSVRLQASETGLASLTGLPDTLESARVEADRLTLDALDVAGQRAESVDLEDLAVTVERLDGGYRLRGLALGRLRVDGLAITAGGAQITSEGPVVLSGIEQGEVTLRLATADERATGAPAVTAITVHRLVVGRVEAEQGVRYVDGARDLLVRAAALDRLEITGLDVPLDADLPLPSAGTVSLGAVDRLRVTGTFLRGLSAGVAVSSRPATGHSLHLAFTGTGADVTVDLGTVALTRLHLTEATQTVRIDEPAVARRVTAEATVDLDAQGVEHVHVRRLHIGELDATHLHYERGDLTVDLVPPQAGTPLDIDGLTVTGLRWRRGTGVTAAVEVEQLGVGLVAELAGTLRAGVDLSVESLHLAYDRGRVSGRVGDVSGAGSVLAGGTAARFALEGLAVGAFAWDGDTLQVGTDDTDGLTIGRLALTNLDWSDGDLRVAVGGGAAAVEDVTVRAAVRFGRAAGGELDLQRFTARIDELRIERALVDGLTVEKRTSRGLARVVVPGGQTATIGPLWLEPLAPEQAVTVERRLVGPTGARDTSVAGRLGITRASVPRLEASVGSWLTASTHIEARELRATAFRSGEVTFGIEQLDLLGSVLGVDLATALGPGGGSAGGPVDLRALQANLRDVAREMAPFGPLLRHVDGHVAAEVVLWGQALPFRVAIVDGAVDLAAARASLPAAVRGIIDVEFEGSTVVLQLDLSYAAAFAPGGLLWLAARHEIIRWDLSGGGFTGLSDTRSIQLLDLLHELRFHPRVADLAAWATSSGSSGPSGVEVRGIDVRLDVTNPAPLRITLPTGGSGGIGGALGGAGVRTAELTVPAGALARFTVTGPDPSARPLAIALHRLTIGSTHVVADVGGGRLDVRSGQLGVRDVDADLDLTGPGQLDARVRALTARGIEVTWIPAGAAP